MGTVTLEQIIQESAGNTQREQRPQKKRRRGIPLWLKLVFDVLIAGALLCLFALPHHVLPQSYEVLEPPAENTTPNTPVDDSMGAKFAENFTATVVKTHNSYSSPNISLTVEKRTQGGGDDLITYYVADIYIRTIECFQTALAENTYGKGISEPFLDIVTDNNAVLAVSGDYYGRHYGPVIRNGVLYRDAAGSGDVCVLYKDGTMKTFAKGTFNAQSEMASGAWQAWCFGPALLTDEGTAMTRFNSSLTPKHPRCAIGYYEPGHYTLVLVDGRQDNYSAGMTLTELSALFESMGCAVAYNLDGGRSAQMAYDGELVNLPYLNGRDVSDIVLIGEVAAE